ncbi:carbohydrate ABC transporter membrane protein 1 (CUT1 family) [Melghirimyces profundicolus]|uniref:Carbohydrate ABC transporter membrane protein 1 (CUT1 family) n=1 Tax=Melghirimyces profundicolus TaxID=1242148 RepID=A0A2T6ATG6_9BACL|nr:sugar ABC transporter permease [Melghirimyces profundicolus]PTX47115.1 carbohydrate ABC transporter membrane protein 1 (CUT1 family) [Melghirimyces profundicolus]
MYAKQRSEWLQQIVFLGPGLFFFTLIVVIPFCLGMVYSLSDWDGISSQVNWVGLDNFKRVFEDQRFLYSFWFTLKYTVIAVILMNMLGFLLAFLLTRVIPWKNAFRTVFFIPHIIGGLMLGFIWQFIFTKGFATLGELTNFSLFNLPWLGTTNTAFWGIVIVTVWQMAGYLMIIYIAGIINIPTEIMEAAEIDGVNVWQKLRYVIVPLVMPSITICYFLSISSCFKIFDINLSLTNGGPFGSTETLALNIYNEAFSNYRYGLGTAKALLFFVIVGTVTLVQVWYTKRKEVEA